MKMNKTIPPIFIPIRDDLLLHVYNTPIDFTKEEASYVEKIIKSLVKKDLENERKTN